MFMLVLGDVLVLIIDTSGAAGQGSVRVGKKGPFFKPFLHYPTLTSSNIRITTLQL